MAIHIESLQIQQFRGIQQLSIPRLNHINLVAGDNNCGKTSLLEALLLLRNPGALLPMRTCLHCSLISSRK